MLMQEKLPNRKLLYNSGAITELEATRQRGWIIRLNVREELQFRQE